MRIAAQKINNNGIEVSRTKVRLTTEKYVKQYGQVCQSLYDMGFIPSPMYFDSDEYASCLFQEFPEIVTLCRNITTGAISLSDKQISYVMRVLGSQHKAYGALSDGMSALQAAQALSDINSFLDKVRFKKKSDLLSCKASLAVSNRVFSSSKIPMDSPYLRECFYVQAGKSIEEFNYSIEIFYEVLNNLGICGSPGVDDDSFFLGDGFTVGDDCYYMPQLISGDIKGDGKYAGLLHDAVENYYSEYYRTRTTVAECLKYEEQMFINAIPASIARINEFRKLHPDYEEFFVDSQKVYWLVDSAPSLSSGVVTERDIYIGEDISNIGRTAVPTLNRLLGYSGQFLYRFDDDINDFEVSGMPVLLYVCDEFGRRSTIEYYPAINVRKKLRTMSIPVSGGEYSRKVMGVDEVKKFLDIDSIEGLADEVAELVTIEYKTHSAEFKKLVGLLVQSLVCVLCDYTLDYRNAPNHLHLGVEYGWVTDEIYLDACVAAENFYENLGF